MDEVLPRLDKLTDEVVSHLREGRYPALALIFAAIGDIRERLGRSRSTALAVTHLEEAAFRLGASLEELPEEPGKAGA